MSVAQKHWLWLCAFSFVIACVYSVGIADDFHVLDSIKVVGKNDALKAETLSLDELQRAATSISTGPLGRPLSLMSFAVEHLVFGGNAAVQRRTNLAIHILNMVLVFLAVRLMLDAAFKAGRIQLDENRRAWAALIVAALWAAHPMHVSSVLYVVQRMTLLSATFSLVAVFFYLLGRYRQMDGRVGWPWHMLALGGALPLALASKENSAVIPGYLFVIELSLLGCVAKEQRSKNWLLGLFLAGIAIPAAGILIFLTVHPEWVLRAYDIRDFSLIERLWSQTRALFGYLSAILWPEVSSFGVYQDDFQISRGWLTPVTTIYSVFGLLALVLISIVRVQQWPLFSFAVCFYLVGHVIESSLIGLEMRFEHRNYLPMLGIFVFLVVTLFSIVGDDDNRKKIIFVFPATFILLLFITWIVASPWSSYDRFHIEQARNRPDSERAQFQLADMYRLYASASEANHEKERFVQYSLEHFAEARRIRPNDSTILLTQYLLVIENDLGCDLTCEQEIVTALSEQRLIDSAVEVFRAITQYPPVAEKVDARQVQRFVDAAMRTQVKATGSEAKLRRLTDGFLE